MEVLIVDFRLEGMTEAEYYRGCDTDAPLFAGIPGLVAKIWLADPETKSYGGIYTFRDGESLEDYLDSDLFRAIQQTPQFVDVRARRFRVLEGPTRITSLGTAQAA